MSARRTAPPFTRTLNLALLGVLFWPTFAVLVFAAADWLRYGGQ